MAGRWAALPLTAASAVALGFLFRQWKQGKVHERHVPRVVISKSGNLKDIESFGDYVGKLALECDAAMSIPAEILIDAIVRWQCRQEQRLNRDSFCLRLLSGYDMI